MHNLEQGSAGQVAFITRAEPAWHLLGTVFEKDKVITISEALKMAHMSGWDVRTVPAPTVLDDGTRVTMSRDANYVVRNNPFTAGQVDVLHSGAGGNYTVQSNEDVFAFADSLQHGAAQLETLGSIDNGRKVFGSFKLDHDLVLDAQGRGDKIASYLLAASSHDGTMPLTALCTPVRVVCQNTLNLSMSKHAVKQAFKLRHTATLAGRAQAARDVLGLANGYFDAFALEAETMIQAEINNTQFHELILRAYPKPNADSAAANTRWDNKINLISDIYGGDVQGPDTGTNVRGTVWGALNAMTERLDWYRTARKGEVEGVASAASGFVPAANAEKQALYNLAYAYAQEIKPISVSV